MCREDTVCEHFKEGRDVSEHVYSKGPVAGWDTWESVKWDAIVMENSGWWCMSAW